MMIETYYHILVFSYAVATNLAYFILFVVSKFVLSKLSINNNVSVALYVMILMLCYFTEPMKDQRLLFNNQL